MMVCVWRIIDIVGIVFVGYIGVVIEIRGSIYSCNYKRMILYLVNYFWYM